MGNFNIMFKMNIKDWLKYMNICRNTLIKKKKYFDKSKLYNIRLFRKNAIYVFAQARLIIGRLAELKLNWYIEK